MPLTATRSCPAARWKADRQELGGYPQTVFAAGAGATGAIPQDWPVIAVRVWCGDRCIVPRVWQQSLSTPTAIARYLKSLPAADPSTTHRTSTTSRWLKRYGKVMTAGRLRYRQQWPATVLTAILYAGVLGAAGNPARRR